MTIVEIIAAAREDFLDDAVVPYLWSDALLERYANEAEKEACRRASLLIDKTNANDSEGSPLPLASLQLVAGTTEYTISKKILRILRCVPSTISRSIDKKTEGWLDEIYPNWRTDDGDPLYFLEEKNKLTVVPIPVVNIAQSVSSITRSGSTATVILGGHGFTTGKTVAHADLDQAEYNVTAGITRIDDDSYSYTVSGTPATPATGTGTATLVDVLSLEVVRLPLADMTIVGAESPEIPEEYHLDLDDYMCHLAYLKQDAETEDIVRSDKYETRFAAKFGPKISAITESNRRRRPRNKGLRAKEFGFA